jgi:hypothetical protein
MSDGRGKNLNVENFFNQSPEFYEVINNHGHQGHQYGNQQQWNYSQYSQEYEFDPQFNDVHDRGGYYPKPAYHEMLQQRQISQRQRQNPLQMQYPMQDIQDYGHGHGPYVPHQPFYHHQHFNQPQHQEQPRRGAQRGQMQQRPPMQQRQMPQPQAYMQPQQYYQDMNYDMNGDHVDYNQTEELTSMLNILGLQLAEEQDEQQVEGEDNFISKQIVLLDNSQLKVFYKNQEGSYFSNEQTYGQGLTKAVVDRSGKHIAVLSIYLRYAMKTQLPSSCTRKAAFFRRYIGFLVKKRKNFGSLAQADSSAFIPRRIN